jgi:hypothetical protein
MDELDEQTAAWVSEFNDDLIRLVDPDRARILDLLTEEGILEARDDGYLYPAEHYAPQHMRVFLGSTGGLLRWTPHNRAWNKATRALRQEYKRYGRIHPHPGVQDDSD